MSWEKRQRMSDRAITDVMNGRYRCKVCKDTGYVTVLVMEDSYEREPCDSCDIYENLPSAVSRVEGL
jgi:hypothetical protein